MDTMLCRGRWEAVNPLLAFHASGVLLPDVSRTRS